MNEQIIPYGKISSTQELGSVIRYRRKELKATQTTAAGLSGVGLRFLSELERAGLIYPVFTHDGTIRLSLAVAQCKPWSCMNSKGEMGKWQMPYTYKKQPY